jgi:pSer/pThr/pTyr-binding forkhead associated (FHA) protein
MLALRVEIPGQKPKHHGLPPKTSCLIGRHPRCDLVINNPSVSGKHAQLEVQDGKVIVQDLGSTNGTWYKHQRVTQTQLFVGDKIRLGGQDMWLLEIINNSKTTPTSSNPFNTAVGVKKAPSSTPAFAEFAKDGQQQVSGAASQKNATRAPLTASNAAKNTQAALVQSNGFTNSVISAWIEPENPNPLFDPLRAVTAFAPIQGVVAAIPEAQLKPRLSMLQAALSVKEIPLKGPKIVLGKPTGAQLIFTEEKSPFYHWKISLIQAESPLFINQQPCFPAESVLRHLDIVVYRDTAFQYLEQP